MREPRGAGHKLENELLVGGVVFSEWTTLMSYEAHSCFVAGLDISTIIICASACESYLRSEAEDFDSPLYHLINVSDIPLDLRERLHGLRKARNEWVHSLNAEKNQEPKCYSTVYTPVLEKQAQLAYETMLQLLLVDQSI
ncbi:hypothetical protein [Roseovarius halotolerans]|uniref:hypothetical protein n=1 Tax=Roseovarius halotolerans TaxID=505353 RepID=UPI00111C0A5E|nr:hypothetical protein [Roseovarius halotolerans]